MDNLLKDMEIMTLKATISKLKHHIKTLEQNAKRYS